MRPGGHSKALLTGPSVRLYDKEIALLIGLDAAAVLQYLHYVGLESPSGWVAMPLRTLAGEVGLPDDSAARRALKVLTEYALLEIDDSRKTHRYRVLPEAAVEALPHRKLTARGLRNPQADAEGLRHSDAIIDSDPSRGAKAPSRAPAHARGEESREEKKREDTSSSLRSSSVGDGQEENPEHDQPSGCCVCEGPTWIADDPVRCARCGLPEPPPLPAEPETSGSRDEPEDNGSGKEEVADAVAAVRETFGRIR